MREAEPTQVQEEAAGASKLPETIEALERVSRNYWWSWTPDGHAVFRDLDQEVWDDCEHNPRRLLKEVPQYSLMRMATDPVYVERVRRLAEGFDAYMASGHETWAARHAQALTHERPVAYFCAEFGVHHSLPLYSGGLGILAGDHLKSASDLGLPLVAVGLLYHHGYFRQHLRRDGWQEEAYQQINVGDLPMQLVRDAGRGARPHRFVRARAQRARAGVARRGRPRAALPARHERRGQSRDRPIHHGPPLRRRPRDALRAGDGLRDRRREASAPVGDRAARLPLERRPLGLPDSGADARADRVGRRVRGGRAPRALALRVHDAHARRRRPRRVRRGAHREDASAKATGSRSGSRATSSSTSAA